MGLIRFHKNSQRLVLTRKKHIKEAIFRMFVNEKKSFCSLDYIFCDNEFLLQLNRFYLNHNYYTDVLTFNLTPNQQHINGEIYISVDMVKENAFRFQTLFEDELVRVIFHAALHLCGYDDQTKKEKKKMKELEDFYLQLFYTVSRET